LKRFLRDIAIRFDPYTHIGIKIVMSTHALIAVNAGLQCAAPVSGIDPSSWQPCGVGIAIRHADGLAA